MILTRRAFTLFGALSGAVALTRRRPCCAGAQAPTIEGAWGRYTARPGQPVDPRFTAPPEEAPQLKPAQKAAYDELRKKERESDARGEPLAGTSVACLPDGMPQMMSAIYPLEILINPGRVTITEEAYNQTRRVWLNEAQIPIADAEPLFYGHSVGRWEGETLVIDTVGIKQGVRGYRDVPHSAQMRIRERIRLVAPDVMHDQITIEDPVILEKPWTFTFAYRRMPGYKMLEYVCEDNREYADDKGQTQIRLGD